MIVGKRKDNWGEPTLHMITGNLWFVDSNYSAAFVDWSRTYYASQQYICQDGKIYLFINHDIGNSWVTDVVTVRDNQVYYILIHGFVSALMTRDRLFLYRARMMDCLMLVQDWLRGIIL